MFFLIEFVILWLSQRWCTLMIPFASGMIGWNVHRMSSHMMDGAETLEEEIPRIVFLNIYSFRLKPKKGLHELVVYVFKGVFSFLDSSPAFLDHQKIDLVY